MLSIEVQYAIDNCEELIKLADSDVARDVKNNILANKLFNEGLADKLFNLGMSRKLWEGVSGSTITEDIHRYRTGLYYALSELKKLRTALEE